MNLDKTIKLCQGDEGFKSHPYFDNRGNVTIGFGNNLAAKGYTMEQAQAMYPNGITYEQALSTLNEQINESIQLLSGHLLIFNSLDDVRQAVLIDMCINLGFPKLDRFQRMFSALNARDFQKASLEILDSLADTQLPTRYHKLSKMMLTGEWPNAIS